MRIHFWFQAAGAVLLFVGLGVGGVVQGLKLANPATPLITVAKGSVPFVGLSTLGITLLLLGQLVLALNLFGLVRRFLEPLARAFCAEVCGCGRPLRTEVKS